MTRALDLDCPRGHAFAGRYCDGTIEANTAGASASAVGYVLCQARINLAARTTRAENKKAREGK